MKVVEGIESLSAKSNTVAMKPSVLTIGNFDGLHMGHQALLKRLIEYASAQNLVPTVMTFEPHPSRVLRPESPPTARILELSDLKSILSEHLHVEQLVLQKFDQTFASLSPTDFLQTIAKRLNIKALIVGHDFAFGRHRAGSFEVLRNWAHEKSIYVEQVDPLLDSGEIISSSAIRARLYAGEIELATKWLTRDYFIRGQVVAGEGRGHQLGFSTANISPTSELIPAKGVYITKLFVDDEPIGLPSVTNIGNKPTFHEQFALTIEAHALNVNRQFRDHNVKLVFLKRLRDELKFASARELISQIQTDVQQTKDFFGLS